MPPIATTGTGSLRHDPETVEADDRRRAGAGEIVPAPT
jgi:hypothetical protein